MTDYKESEIRTEILKTLAQSPDGFATTTQLIEDLAAGMQPSGHDAEILDGRSDTVFSQKVRNTISHRGSATSLESRGLAIYVKSREGWEITDLGRDQA